MTMIPAMVAMAAPTVITPPISGENQTPSSERDKYIYQY